MKKRLLGLIPYLGIMFVLFYLLPVLVIDTGSAMLMLLIVIPIITFICSVIYGVRNGFNIVFPIATMILFTPTIIIFYNLSAWVYIVAYGGIVLVGNGIGLAFHRKQQ